MADKKKRKFRFPIIAKTVLMIFIFSFVVVEMAMTYYSLVSSNRNKETYFNYTESLASTIAQVLRKDDYQLVVDKVGAIYNSIPLDEVVTSEEPDETKQAAYMAHYDVLYKDTEFMTVFNSLTKTLKNIASSNTKFSVTSIYLVYLRPYNDAQGQRQGHWIYLADSSEEDPCPPGWVDPLYPENYAVLDDPTIGFPPYVTDTSYGYLVTSGSLITGSDMVYATVDVSMTAVRANQASSIIRLFVYLFITVNLVAAIGVVLVYFLFTRPMNKLNRVAKAFDNSDPEKTHELFVNLKVNTRDEISELANSMKTMEEGVHERINQLVEMNEELKASQNETAKMSALANKDALTGVKSKIAYHNDVESLNEQITKGENPVFGIAMVDLNYLKNINDEFGHNAGDETIVRLSNLICLTFKHSPVYRVGGDEFVVILKGEDYKHSKELVDEFNERVEDSIKNKNLKPYEKVSAAIGYVEYDSKLDKIVDDVFARADQEMYKRKHQMKAQ